LQVELAVILKDIAAQILSRTNIGQRLPHRSQTVFGIFFKAILRKPDFSPPVKPKNQDFELRNPVYF
jgi:hypothetical protein